MTDFKPHYSPKHPKINVYSNGVYKYSTNWFPTCKLAKQKAENAGLKNVKAVRCSE